MKKALIPVVMSSVFFCGGVMAAAADNDSSHATLNFTGKVTSNLCQVSTTDTVKDINLGEVTKTQITSGAYRPQSFTVTLNNCDTTTNSISYTIADNNGSAGATGQHLEPLSDDTSARGVGVFIQKSDGTAVQIGQEQSITVQKEGANALPQQSIALRAYISKKAGVTDANVSGGTVNANATMTIKTAVATAAPGTI